MAERKPVRAIAADDMFADAVPDGAFKFKGDRILVQCPCGCGSLMNLKIRIKGEPENHPSWEWDGNRDAPTLSPSIRDVGSCFFHGHLRAGIWTFCKDSGVKRPKR